VTAKQAGPMKLEEVHCLAEKEEQQALLAQKKAASKGSSKNMINLKTYAESKQSSTTKQRSGGDEPKAQRSPQKKAAKASPTAEKAAKASPTAEKAASGTKTSQPHHPRGDSTPYAGNKAAPSPKSSSSETSPRTAAFDLRAFRRELTEVMKELGASRDTARARRRFDGLKVPKAFQAAEFSNLVTRVAEERCSASRRAMFAFVAGLAGSVFDKDMCEIGLKAFFDDVYEDLCEEVPRLHDILKTELVPTMRAALSGDTLQRLLPLGLK